MGINHTDLARFHTDGLVTLSPDFPGGWIEAANEAINALDDTDFSHEGGRGLAGWYMAGVAQPQLLRFVYDAFFEDAAKKVLRADAVELALVSLRVTKPKPNALAELEPQHVDFKCGTAAAGSTPVAMPCSFFVWLTDVQADNCPLYYRPGSHLQVMRYMDAQPDDNNYEIQQVPPNLKYAPAFPVFAQSGQVSTLSGTLVHGGSVTPGHRERRLLVIEFRAKGTDIPLYAQFEERSRKYLRELKNHLPSDRLHLLPE